MSAGHYWVYMLSNNTRSVLYIGVTNDLVRRVADHRGGELAGFTQQYHCIHLVYYEEFRNIRDAIRREKQLKGWKRAKKNDLIAKMNPRLDDLYLPMIAQDENCLEVLRLRFASAKLRSG